MNLTCRFFSCIKKSSLAMAVSFIEINKICCCKGQSIQCASCFMLKYIFLGMFVGCFAACYHLSSWRTKAVICSNFKLIFFFFLQALRQTHTKVEKTRMSTLPVAATVWHVAQRGDHRHQMTISFLVRSWCRGEHAKEFIENKMNSFWQCSAKQGIWVRLSFCLFIICLFSFFR